MSEHNRLDIFREAIKATTGEIWECGCYRGDFAAQLIKLASHRTVRLFDTFEGMPHSGARDVHKVGSMNASYCEVCDRFKDCWHVSVYRGLMPQSFAGLETCKISVVNLDVDNEQSVRECLPWLYERLEVGGYLMFDDYNCNDCKGAHIAVDEFLRDKPEQIKTFDGYRTVIPQAYIVKQ